MLRPERELLQDFTEQCPHMTSSTVRPWLRGWVCTFEGDDRVGSNDMPSVDGQTASGSVDPAAIADDDRERSRYMRWLIQHPDPTELGPGTSQIPRLLVQFWDRSDSVPDDVRECLDSWRALEDRGFERRLFDDRAAAQFISEHFGGRHSEAFARCRHPAMRSDYFRLCFLAMNGGFYVDADDVYQGSDCEHLFQDDRLKLQPLCYDAATDAMVDAEGLIAAGNDASNWTFYVNNNPLIAPPAHPIVRLALERSTSLLESQVRELRDVQSITGPGNITASLVRHALASDVGQRPRDFTMIVDWNDVAISRWPLSYRFDERNWRLWARSS